MKSPALILAALLGLAAPALMADIHVGDTFPSLSAAGLTSASKLPDVSGKVLLVDFWASWCAPCKASFPSYAKLNADYASKGLVIVAVSVDQDPAAYRAFAAKFSPPFAIAHDQSHSLVAQVAVPTMPTSYLVDASGKVRSIHTGFHGEATERALRSEIDALLAGK